MKIKNTEINTVVNSLHSDLTNIITNYNKVLKDEWLASNEGKTIKRNLEKEYKKMYDLTESFNALYNINNKIYTFDKWFDSYLNAVIIKDLKIKYPSYDILYSKACKYYLDKEYQYDYATDLSYFKRLVLERFI